MTRPLRVGIIGVGSDGSWAREAHLPAVQAVDGLELVAVSARGQERADAIATSEGVARAYGDAAALIADPDLDVVVVGAPVPAHAELITAAVAAGKHVVTEWPLGVDSRQNEELAAIVADSGVLGAVGLQARYSAATGRAREFIAAGALGRVLTVSAVSSTAGWGPAVPESAEYLEDPANAMHLTTIQTAHTLDLLGHLVAPIERLSVLASIQYPTVEIAGTRRVLQRSVPDHLAIQGILATKVPFMVEMRAGCAPEATPFVLRIHGAKGDLELRGGSPRGFQASRLSLVLDGVEVPLDDATDGLAPSVANVAGLYAGLRDAVTTGSATIASFEDAARLGHLVDDIRAASSEKPAVVASRPWPV